MFAGLDYRIDSLPGDASFRRYHRVYIDPAQSDEFSDEVYIVMDAPPELESIVEFVAVDELMASVINVPSIMAKDMAHGFLLLQDFGQVEFAHLLPEADAATIDGYYQHAMRTLVALQSLDVPVSDDGAYVLPEYDEALLTREMQLFEAWFLPHVGINLDAEAHGEVRAMWERLMAAINTAVLAQPTVVVHRDYHSRNLMQDRNDPERLGVIDFQDAVRGAYSYDLVSLVRDAYVNWDEAQISQWVADFMAMQTQERLQPASFEGFYENVTVMGAQRHLKILGIFIRLAERDGKTRYLADIPKVMNDLLYELGWLRDNAQNHTLKQAAGEFLLWLEGQVIEPYKLKFGIQA